MFNGNPFCYTRVEDKAFTKLAQLGSMKFLPLFTRGKYLSYDQLLSEGSKVAQIVVLRAFSRRLAKPNVITMLSISVKIVSILFHLSSN